MTAGNTAPQVAAAIEHALREEIIDTFHRSTYAELTAAVLAVPVIAAALAHYEACDYTLYGPHQGTCRPALKETL